jgi:hypothetical protein
VEAWCPRTVEGSYLLLKGLIDEHVVPMHFALGSAVK